MGRPVGHFIKNSSEILRENLEFECIAKYPILLKKDHNFGGDVVLCWKEHISNFIYDNDDNYNNDDLTTSDQVIEKIKLFMNNFLEEIVDTNACGAFIRIIKTEKLETDKLTSEYVYNMMWPNNEIADAFGDDFEFDIDDFGFEYFEWCGEYFITSGIPC